MVFLLKSVIFVDNQRSSMAKHEELPIPIYSSLEHVYGDGSPLEEAQLRYDTLKSKFLQVFGHPPDVYARSPGPILHSFIQLSVWLLRKF